MCAAISTHSLFFLPQGSSSIGLTWTPDPPASAILVLRLQVWAPTPDSLSLFDKCLSLSGEIYPPVLATVQEHGFCVFCQGKYHILR